MTTNNVIFLSNVRLSFPHLKEPHSSGPGATPKYSADLLMAQDHKGFKDFMQVYGQMAAEKWGENAPQVMQMIQSERKLRCYGMGTEKVNKKTFKPYDGYEGMVYLSASRADQPQIIKADGTPVDPSNTMEAQAITRSMYGGCYVNAAVRPWLQDNKHGRGVRLDLVAVQFNRDGEAFGEGKTDVSGMFGAAQAAPVSDEPAPSATVPGMPDLPFNM